MSAVGTSLRSLRRNNSVAFGAKRTTVETGAVDLVVAGNYARPEE